MANSCIYYPPLECKDNNINKQYGNKNYIMKITLKNKENIGNEIIIGNVIKKIDPNFNYFAYAITECILKKIPKKCKFYDKKFMENNDTEYENPIPYAFIIYYGGKTISEWLKKNNLNTIELLKILIHLANAYKLLNDLYMTHGDLHEDQIIIDKNKHVRIIDFSGHFYKTDEEKHAMINTIIGSINFSIPEWVEKKEIPYKLILQDDIKSFYPDFKLNTDTDWIKKLYNLCNNNKKQYINTLYKYIKNVEIKDLGIIYEILFEKTQFQDDDKYIIYKIYKLILKMKDPNIFNSVDINYILTYLNNLSINKHTQSDIIKKDLDILTDICKGDLNNFKYFSDYSINIIKKLLTKSSNWLSTIIKNNLNMHESKYYKLNSIYARKYKIYTFYINLYIYLLQTDSLNENMSTSKFLSIIIPTVNRFVDIYTNEKLILSSNNYELHYISDNFDDILNKLLKPSKSNINKYCIIYINNANNFTLYMKKLYNTTLLYIYDSKNKKNPGVSIKTPLLFENYD